MENIIDKEHHRITLTAIIYKEIDGEFQYLITRRSLDKKVFPGKWTVPGGGLETDDYINSPANSDGLWYFAVENALKREVMEEVNLEIEKVKYLLDITFIRPDGFPAIVLSFYGKYIGGEVKLDADSIEYTWATYEQCKSYELIGGILEEIELVDGILNGGNEEDLIKNSKLRI